MGRQNGEERVSGLHSEEKVDRQRKGWVGRLSSEGGEQNNKEG